MRQFTASLLAIALAATMIATRAEAPQGYYSSCEGKCGSQLLQTLRQVVGPHTTISYDGLWDIYPETDSDPDGKLWDMYSTKRWTWGNRPCGNYSNVGDCYNREHSFPKSWFSEGSPMKSDAFHVYPTDGKVNGQRSNFPYGECEGGSTLPSSGGVRPLGRLGASTFPGYSGKVFEPDDEYKGDLARTYFYMAACYNDRIAQWDSPMLAGNAYPAFADWSVSLLLKWHREDPVSQKELDRNDAVYRYQHNRNPFIDHPEMAEHVWGASKTQGWSSTSTPTPVLVRPAEGAVIDLGTISAGVTRYYSVYVSGTDFSEPLAVSVAGDRFRASASSIPAASVNSGTSLTISALSPNEGTFTGTLTLSNSSVTRTAQLRATVINGLPALPATNVTEESFTARWVNIDSDEAVYTIHIMLDGEYLPGFPKEVMAEEESLNVTGLEPATTYTYYVTNWDLVSNTVTVTTASPEPMIQLLYSGELMLAARPGAPSDAKEIELYADNIDCDITLRVAAPFEASDDMTSWANTLTLSPDTPRFYIRLNGDEPGSYSTSLALQAGDYLYDDITAEGIIADDEAICETFETDNWKDNYNNGTYQGVAGRWNLVNAGVYSSDSRLAFEGYGCCRLGKSADSSISSDFDLLGGIGAVTFMAQTWSGDPEAVIDVEYSTDGGENWTPAGTVTIPESTAYNEYSVAVNAAGPARMRLQQKSGSRVLIDNISATSYSISSLPLDESESWTAYCRSGRLVIDSARPAEFTVYSIDAITVYTGIVAGTAALPLTPGVYIVVSGDQSKKAVIR